MEEDKVTVSSDPTFFFSRGNITEDQLVKSLEWIKEHNRNSLENYYKRKQVGDKKARKPYKLGNSAFLRGGKIPDELLFKYKRELFASKFDLALLLTHQPIPEDIIKRYLKRIKKSVYLSACLLTQILSYHKTGVAQEIEEIILQDWDRFRLFLNTEKLVKAAMKIPSFAVLLKLE